MTLYKNLIRDNMLKMKNSCRGISRNIFNDFLILRTAFFKKRFIKGDYKYIRLSKCKNHHE